MAQLSARAIREDFARDGIAALIDSAARSIHTLPGTIGDDYAKLLEVLEENSDRFGVLQSWQAEKAASELVGKIYGAVYGGNADRIIVDHIRPALADYLDRFRADLNRAGQHASATDAGALLSQPDDVRQAYVRLVDSYSEYAALRYSWEVCRKRNAHDYSGTGTIDPSGLTSPLAEVANMPDLFADWQLAHAGRKPWPWKAHAHHVRFVWLLSNGANIVMPTGQEQDQTWAKYNPGRRAIAA